MKDVNCKHCGRYLFKAAGTVVIEQLVCPKSSCRAKLNFKMIQADTVLDLTHKFVHPEVAPKQKDVEVS